MANAPRLIIYICIYIYAAHADSRSFNYIRLDGTSRVPIVFVRCVCKVYSYVSFASIIFRFEMFVIIFIRDGVNVLHVQLAVACYSHSYIHVRYYCRDLWLIRTVQFVTIYSI